MVSGVYGAASVLCSQQICELLQLCPSCACEMGCGMGGLGVVAG